MKYTGSTLSLCFITLFLSLFYSQDLQSQSPKRYYFSTYQELVKFFEQPTNGGVAFASKPTEFYADVYKTRTLDEAITACIFQDQKTGIAHAKSTTISYGKKNGLLTIGKQEIPEVSFKTGSYKQNTQSSSSGDQVRDQTQDNNAPWKIIAPGGETHGSQEYDAHAEKFEQLWKLPTPLPHGSSIPYRADLVERDDGSSSLKVSLGDFDVCERSRATSQRMGERYQADVREHQHKTPTHPYLLLQEGQQRHHGWMQTCIKSAKHAQVLLVRQCDRLLSLNPPVVPFPTASNGATGGSYNEALHTQGWLYEEIEKLTMAFVRPYRNSFFGMSTKDLNAFIQEYDRAVDRIVQEFYQRCPLQQSDLFTAICLSHRTEQASDRSSRTQSTCNTRAFDYSSRLPPPIPGDHYADVFKNTYGTMQDYELHKELHQTRTKIIELERKFPHCDHVRFVAPVVHHIAARAKAESDSTKARDLSKFCQTITSVISKCAHTIDVVSRSAKSTARGVIKGVQKVLTVEHWKEMATGALHLGLLLVKAVNQHDENDQAACAALLSNNGDTPFKFEKEYTLKVKTYQRAITQSIQKTYQKMKTMTWEQLLENGVEVGTTLVLDIVTLNALNGLACRTSRMVVEEIGRALEQSACYAAEEYMVEVAGFGKLIIDEGREIVPKAAEIIKNAPALLIQEGKTAAKVMQESVKNVAFKSTTTDAALFKTLTPIGNNRFVSKGKLIFGDDRKFGNRLNHVLDHMRFNINKETHTIFSCPKEKLIELLDEAWAMKGNALKQGATDVYRVAMNRIIGTEGKVEIMLVVKTGTAEVVTAYPIKLPN
jgi:filamentous hemagglutinin